MITGLYGAFVISWAQTEIDGLDAVGIDALIVGAAWRWSGEAIRVDGPGELLILDNAEGAADLRKRAARVVRRLVGAALQPQKPISDIEVDDGLPDYGFVLTDGRRTFTVSIVDVGRDRPPLLMFLGVAPPAETDLWVVSHTSFEEMPGNVKRETEGVICFAKGTRILTPDGLIPVENLCEGDQIRTKDNGAQEIRWIGQRRMSGARLYTMPHLRPVRIKAGALGQGEPDDDLLVSPEHRVLIKGRAAQALFNTDEVLVKASNLLNDRSILIDHTAREVTYIHLMLEQHQIVWANGVECESFHPANTAMEDIDPVQRAVLFDRFAGLENDPHRYGEYARRNLSPSEAEILKYDSVVHH
jgi:hypothetical protein